MEPIIKNQDDTTQLLFAISYFSDYRYLKESVLWNEYINLENILPHLTYLQYESIRQMIEVEEIVNAIQYCIDLGGIAICVDKRDINRLGYKLANMAEGSVTQFYDEIGRQKMDQIKRYMGYHDIITDKNKNYKYMRSCKRYQYIVGIIAKFYADYYDLYLSYKHGLRIAPMGCNNGRYRYFTTMKIRDNYALREYCIPVLEGVIRSVFVCDSIKTIFDKLYLPIIRRYFLEFISINKEEMDLKGHVTSAP